MGYSCYVRMKHCKSIIIEPFLLFFSAAKWVIKRIFINYCSTIFMSLFLFSYEIHKKYDYKQQIQNIFDCKINYTYIKASCFIINKRLIEGFSDNGLKNILNPSHVNNVSESCYLLCHGHNIIYIL